MLQLPNIEETQDPVPKKVILAIQELADQMGTRGAVIFNDMNEQIKGLRTDMKQEFANQNERLEQEFANQNEILFDMATALKTIEKNTEK